MSEINWIGILGSITTVVAFVAFLAIVAWAYSGRRKAAFDAAATRRSRCRRRDRCTGSGAGTQQ